MLTTGELYNDLGGDYFRKRDPERTTKRLVAQLESLGHKLVLEQLPQAASTNTAQPWRGLSCQESEPPRVTGTHR